eukprot:4020008-Pleurochrysis_carterae.AAC.1
MRTRAHTHARARARTRQVHLCEWACACRREYLTHLKDARVKYAATVSPTYSPGSIAQVASWTCNFCFKVNVCNRAV